MQDRQMGLEWIRSQQKRMHGERASTRSRGLGGENRKTRVKAKATTRVRVVGASQWGIMGWDGMGWDGMGWDGMGWDEWEMGSDRDRESGGVGGVGWWSQTR